MTEETKEIAVQETTPVALQLSEQAIATVKHNIQLCEQLVREVLEKEIDWGTIPGIDQPCLWDSGAAKIMAAFNCYTKYTLLEKTDKLGKMSFTFYVELIHRHSQQIIATGVGASSTTEKKYKYIYKEKDAEGEQLLNTICKMAAKRADVDAVTSLPGVAATLRKLFQGKQQEPLKPNWRLFRSKLNTLGVNEEDAHTILGVASIKDDWIGIQHKTLNEAYEVIKAAVEIPQAAKGTTEDGEKLI